ncbi:hypothetical protein [Vibrio gangliei]|uniref:hypothetical protein n=1 Tax=Vibrio gangliei TaxID=2077090 RepID=UPI000D013EB2|nr:hypothetical protein [Vibrio gangliei]
MNSGWANFFPYFAGALKIIVTAIGAYFAIKWHFDEDRRVKEAAGVVFEPQSSLKKLLKMLAIPVILTVLVVAVVYATNWYFD